MEGFQFLLFTLLIALTGCSLILVTPNKYQGWVNSIVVFLIAIISSVPAIQVILGTSYNHIVQQFGFLGDVPIRIDLLSAWFMLLLNLIFTIASLYAIGYLKPSLNNRSSFSIHWINFIIFHVSILWVCVLQNFLAFLIAWEVMSLSSLMLILFNSQNVKVLKAGINYLIQMHIGVAFLTLAFLWVYVSEGSMDFLAIKSFFSHHSNGWLFLIFFIGFGFKSAFMPFHTWSPYVQTHAPAHVSAMMAVKIGMFGLLKIVFFLQADYLLIGQWVLSISIIAALYGIINATVHRNYMTLLAYSSVENMGIIGAGIGLGLLGLGYQNTLLTLVGFGAALLHLFNHSLFKPLLFFAAGSVYQKTNTRDMDKLGGIIKNMPQTAFIFLIGSLAICGFPPFNGFISEFMLYYGFLGGIKNVSLYHEVILVSAMAGISLIGGISIYSFTKSFGVIFLGSARTNVNIATSETDKLMRLPQYLLVALILTVGLFPAFYIEKVFKIVLLYFPFINNIEINGLQFINQAQSVGKYAVLFLAFTALILFVRYFFVRKQSVVVKPTWGCGYAKPSPRIQYTGKSFSKTIGKLLSTLVFENKRYKELTGKEYFPKGRTHSASYTDLFEYRIVDKSLKRILYFMNRFQFIQNGKLQRYIVYGLVFIALIFLGTIFNFL